MSSNNSIVPRKRKLLENPVDLISSLSEDRLFIDGSEENSAKEATILCKQEPSHCRFEISVYQYGDISEKTLKVWRNQLLKKFGTIIKNCVDETTSLLVVYEKCPLDKLLRWTRWDSTPDKETLSIVKPSWIIELIETSKYPPIEKHLHPLQRDSLLKAPTANSEDGVQDINSQTYPEVGVSREQKDPKSRRFEGFACVQSGRSEASQNNPIPSKNKLLVDTFQELQEIYDSLGDEWRAKTYKKVCNTKRLEWNYVTVICDRITNSSQLKHVKGFGDSVLKKIEELVDTGSLRKLNSLKSDPKVAGIVQLKGVWGIGPKFAATLVERGYRSISDLRARGAHLLNEQQTIGLRCYEEFLTRIPRNEVESIEAFVLHEAALIIPGVECITCGSYRRGKSSSGDVDILFGPPPGQETIQILPALIRRLSEIGFLTDHLAGYAIVWSGYLRITTTGGTIARATWESAGILVEERNLIKILYSYDDALRLPQEGSLHRRIDMKSYPRSTFPFALLYFTGSDHFNRSMRLYAKKIKKLQLNDKGLFPCERDRVTGKVLVKGCSVRCMTERDIFERLDLEYKEPVERNCDDIDNTVLGNHLMKYIGESDDEDSDRGDG